MGWYPNYLLFAGSDYYPLGGAKDLKLTFQAIDGAAACVIAERCVSEQLSEHREIDWWEVFLVSPSGLLPVEKWS